MREELISSCETCGEDRDLEQDHWYTLHVDGERLFFCSKECRENWKT